MRDAFINSLIELAHQDETICLLTGDLGFGVVEKFAEKFPDRFWNCGVAEQSMLSISAGLAKAGLRPFVYSIANFPTFRALEQIRNDICYHNLPVTIVSVGGGLGYGTLGYTHHGIEDLAVMRVLPNIAVYSPSDPNETKDVLADIQNTKNPAYLRLGKNGEPKILDSTNRKILGRIKELKNGNDLSVISCGAITENCLNVAKELANDFQIQVISVSKVQSIEIDFLLELISSKKVLVVEEHVERGGLASSLLEAFNRIGSKFNFSHAFVKEQNITITGSQEFLRGLSDLDKPGLKRLFFQQLNS